MGRLVRECFVEVPLQNGVVIYLVGMGVGE